MGWLKAVVPCAEGLCYQWKKHVDVETLIEHPDVIYSECKHDFVESFPIPPPHLYDLMDYQIPPFCNEIVQFLRAIASPVDDNDFPFLTPPQMTPFISAPSLRNLTTITVIIMTMGVVNNLSTLRTVALENLDDYVNENMIRFLFANPSRE
ncbi:hypothetical protein L2E82_18961 [Cichorium intybus]|uniref:Uncharacterized protein n=1 Tax=Cichorium intybus TaxID=13427 RepID=A0ACB9FB47_CICIN|nr:hypothetical protein L2E82_18961 [Cichorium intybus]